MKALRKIQPQAGASLAEIQEPRISGGEVLVKVRAAALCGSDVDMVNWTSLVQRANYALPVTLGHEFCGEVIAAGENVKTIRPGDLIAAETHNPCDVCYTCRTGNRHICPNGMGVLGRTMDGAFAEYIKIPEVMAVKIPPGISSRCGALMEPLATAVHCLSKGIISGDSVAILGAGAIGQMAIDIARALGAAKIFVLSRSEKKLAESRRRGADVVINGDTQDFVKIIKEETGGVGVGAAIDMTGDEKVLNGCVEALRVAGRLVCVGMVKKPLTFDNFMYGVVYKELIVTGIFGRRMFETWETLFSLLRAGRLELESYISAEYPLAEYHKAFEAFPLATGRILLTL
ncbi:MAG: zinc-binding dehydrogenase [Spirochaetaceae bacterium]|nr:zinc-binding dehydrogenase [Spirochaetaceae bacterium]